MIKSTHYPHQSLKATLTKSQQLRQNKSNLILESFYLYEGDIDAETVWMAIKSKGIELSISTFYNRLKELVEEDL